MRFWPLAGLLVSCAAPAAAQGIDLSSGGPVDVTARGGFEWRETEQEVIADGDARATRGTVTVLADRLVARYRKKPGTAPEPVAAKPADAGSGVPDAGQNEVYRLEAEGHVRIVTATDEAVADHAVYDIDQAVLVLTGKALKLTTPQQTLTARDSMEYWSQRRMAVGRGDAVVLTSDARRLQADTLVAYTKPPEASAIKPASAGKPPAPGDPIATSGKLDRVEAFGNVEVRTTADTVRGDRGVYVPDTGVARVIGHVRITHGQNQLNGPAADVNMKTGVARILANPAGRVEGMLVPNGPTPGQAGALPAGLPK